MQTIYVLAFQYFMSKFERISIELRSKYMKLIQSVNEIIENINKLVILNGLQYIRRRYNDDMFASYKINQKSNKYFQMLNCISSMMELLIQIFVIGVGGWMVIRGRFTIGLTVSYLSYSSMFHSALEEIFGIWSSYSENKASIDRVNSILEEEACYQSNICNDEGKIAISAVYLNNVTFAYGNNTILSEASAVFTKERINYVVGKSGVGKSTILNLLLGYISPDTGNIKLDGLCLSEVFMKGKLASYISWIPQEPIIFSDSVINNIKLDNDLSEEKIIDICKLCDLHEDILRLPDGYSTKLGDHGNLLSVGQKHKLGMARAMTNIKPILLIDEGTAGIDRDTEKVLKSSLMEIGKNRLVIVITHSMDFIIENANVFELRDCKLVHKEI